MESCVDQTLAAALPDYGDQADDSGEVFAVDIAQIPKSLEKDDKSVKMLIRSHGLSVMREERKHFWKGIYNKRESVENIEANRRLYWETVKTCFGSIDLPGSLPPLPDFLDKNHCNSYCLNTAGKISVCRVLTCFAYNNPDIQYCPELYSFTAILRHYLPEDQCYGFICNMSTSRQPRYFAQSQLQHSVEWRTVAELQKEYNKKALSILNSELSNDDMEKLHQNWIWFIFDGLPLPHIVRVVDCFLVEGQKILFRISLSIMRQLFKQLRSSPDWRMALKQRGGAETVLKFCQDIPIAPYILLDRCFRFRGLAQAKMTKLSLAIEVDLKAKSLAGANGTENVDDVRKISNQQQQQQPGFTSTYPVNDLNSEILSREALIRLWQWLPARVASVTPTLAYSTNVHGTSLTTFYAKSELYEQTILTMKTMTGEVVGAYCSSSWKERQESGYFGTGETFLFRFDEGKSGEGAKRYRWVDLDQKDQNELSKAEMRAREMFMCGKFDLVAIGGGNGNGIFIDRTLTYGKTEKCSTFDNEPLCREGDFKIAILEVFGLTPLDD